MFHSQLDCRWLCIVIDLSLVLFKKVFGHVLLLPFSQNLFPKFYPIGGHNSSLNSLWRLGYCFLWMPRMPHEAHKRILAKSKKVATRLSNGSKAERHFLAHHPDGCCPMCHIISKHRRYYTITVSFLDILVDKTASKFGWFWRATYITNKLNRLWRTTTTLNLNP